MQVVRQWKFETVDVLMIWANCLHTLNLICCRLLRAFRGLKTWNWATTAASESERSCDAATGREAAGGQFKHLQAILHWECFSTWFNILNVHELHNRTASLAKKQLEKVNDFCLFEYLASVGLYWLTIRVFETRSLNWYAIRKNCKSSLTNSMWRRRPR